MSDDPVTKVAQLTRGVPIGMLTTRDRDGTLMSRPMAQQEVEFDGDLWYFAERGSRKVEQVRADMQVNVALASGSSWVSLTGDAEVVEGDVTKKRDLWNAATEAWLPQGPDSEDVVLIKIHATSAEYWDSPGGRIATALSFVKSKVKGERTDTGENERTEL